jgi:drug/metabolite transporter (DMT)-like permease
MVMTQTLRREQSTYWQGIALVGLFVLLSSAREVYVGHLVQHVDPFLLVCCCFFVVTAFFVSLHAAFGSGGYIESIRTHFRDVLGLNVTTAVCWVAGFYALRFIEPSIENSIVTATGPAITLLAGFSFGSKRKALRAEVLSSAGIVLVIVFMAAISLLNKAGVSHASTTEVLIGILCCLLASVGIVANTIFSKRLSNAGLSTSFVLAVRFYLLITFSVVMIATSHPSFDAVRANLPGIGILATAGITLPLFVLQKGIERSEPLTVSFILVLAPVFIYLFERFDARLYWSGFTLFGITAVMMLVIVSIVARHRSFQ